MMTRFLESVRRRARNFFAASERLLLPPRCAYCDEDFFPTGALHLCGQCRASLASPLGRVCRRCSAAIPASQPAESTDCVQCSAEPWHLDQVISLGHYHGDLRAAVLRAKLAHEEALARTLGMLLFEERRESLAALRPDAILPIPMHWTRRIARGVNSAEIFADEVAKGLGAPMATGVIRRIRRTEKHGYISRHKRFQNMRGALRVSSAYDLADAKILLVDDILTTGVTANEAAKVLRAAGACQIFVAIIARAESDH